MKRKILSILGFALIAGLAGAVVADGGRWVSSAGDEHDLTGKQVMFFGDGDFNEFDLGELTDGETRTFGSGEHELKATRAGNVVTLTRGDGEGHGVDMTCDVDGDRCVVLTSDDSERVMVKIARTRVCKDGEGDCEDIDVHAVHGGHHGDGKVVVRKIVTCDGDEGEDCVDIDVRAIGGDGDGEHRVFVDGGAGDALLEIRGDHVTLRCPEGDSSIRVDRDEAGETFLCPKHSTPMERSQDRGRHVIIERRHD